MRSIEAIWCWLSDEGIGGMGAAGIKVCCLKAEASFCFFLLINVLYFFYFPLN